MIEKTFDAPHPVRLDLKVLSADIAVTTVDGTECSVAVSGAERMLEATTVELIGDRLVVEMQRKLFGRWGPQLPGEGLRIRVTLPHGSRADLHFAAGDATLEGTFARAEVHSVSGGIRAAGEILDDVVIKTVSGNARLAKVGGDLTAGGVSGDVVADAVGGSVSAKSVSGSIRIGSVREGQVKVQSVSGDVEIGIAAGSNLDVDASSASGVLSSEVPLSGQPGNTAGPTVKLRGKTVSGDLRLFRAA
ncbi:MAG TPA: DUF4097 family beta strand repeat-containing protein [Mycobacteriales bacterium]|nr:DUF4097 family beta strand repeat-containing protein [Mycobacteriales bacterium]